MMDDGTLTIMFLVVGLSFYSILITWVVCARHSAFRNMERAFYKQREARLGEMRAVYRMLKVADMTKAERQALEKGLVAKGYGEEPWEGW